MLAESAVIETNGTRPTPRMLEDSEERLIARCRAGDLDAFGEVYAQYERSVFRYAYHLLGHREDADDIKQETFLRAYRAIEGFRGESGLLTWLLRICGNLCRDRAKSWDRRNVGSDIRLEQDALPDRSLYANPHELAERSETRALVLRALGGLPPAQREVVVLHDVEGLGYGEIAQVLGCSVASVKLRVFRARRCLRERVASLMKERL